MLLLVLVVLVVMMLVDVADLYGCTVRRRRTIEIVVGCQCDRRGASCLVESVEWDDDGYLYLQRESLVRGLLRSFSGVKARSKEKVPRSN